MRPYGQRRKKNCNALERAALYLQRAAGVLEAVEGAQRVTLSEAVGGKVRRLRLFAYAREQLVLFAMKGSGRGVRGSRGAASTLAVPAGRAGSGRRLEALQRGPCEGGKLRPLLAVQPCCAQRHCFAPRQNWSAQYSCSCHGLLIQVLLCILLLLCPCVRESVSAEPWRKPEGRFGHLASRTGEHHRCWFKCKDTYEVPTASAPLTLWSPARRSAC